MALHCRRIVDGYRGGAECLDAQVFQHTSRSFCTPLLYILIENDGLDGFSAHLSEKCQILHGCLNTIRPRYGDSNQSTSKAGAPSKAETAVVAKIPAIAQPPARGGARSSVCACGYDRPATRAKSADTSRRAPRLIPVFLFPSLLQRYVLEANMWPANSVLGMPFDRAK